MIDQKKNDLMRAKLILRAKSSEVLEKMKTDNADPELWYQLGMAYGDELGPEAAIDTFSEGLVRFPFRSDLYFARGRKCIGLRKYWRALADFTLAIHLEPELWNNWYYRAVTYNLSGHPEEAVSDFRQCLNLTVPEDQYPIIDWIFLTCAVDMGRMDEAREILGHIDDAVVPPKMDYGYQRRVRLYKGLIKPEKFIDIEDIKTHMINQPGRLDLELKSLTFGLFVYYTYCGETAKANEQLVKVVNTEPSAAFGYLKAHTLATARGLI